jgi:hypothetical protein
MKDSIMQEIAMLKGVEEVLWTENITGYYDYHKMLPPVSFRVSVKGGKKKKIAKIIGKYKIAGVQSVGDTAVDVKGVCGFTYRIWFQRIV